MHVHACACFIGCLCRWCLRLLFKWVSLGFGKLCLVFVGCAPAYTSPGPPPQCVKQRGHGRHGAPCGAPGRLAGPGLAHCVDQQTRPGRGKKSQCIALGGAPPHFGGPWPHVLVFGGAMAATARPLCNPLASHLAGRCLAGHLAAIGRPPAWPPPKMLVLHTD